MKKQPLDDTKAEPQPVGNPAAWVDLYADYLFRYALLRIADREVAEDLVQETFSAAIAAFNNSRFLGKSSERTWLTGILKNKILDFLRKKYRHRTLPLDQIGEDAIEESFDARGNWRVRPGKWGSNPLDQCEQQELAGILMACIEALQEKQADAIRMREFDELDPEEICKVLMISATNYWVLLHRARLALRRCLERRWTADS